jgi:cobalt/nickel transport system permease protein
MEPLLLTLLIGHDLPGTDPDDVAVGCRCNALNPTLKILAAVAFAVAVAFLNDLGLLVIAMGVAVVGLLASGLRPSQIRQPLVSVALLAAFASVSVGVFRGPTAGFLLFLRILAATAFFLAMALTTTSTELAYALRRLGLPRLLSNTLLLTYRYFFLFRDEADTMERARIARGFRKVRGFLPRQVLQMFSYNAGMLLVRAHARSQSLYRAMLSRQFTGDLPVEGGRRIAARDVAFFVPVVLVSAWLLAASLGVVPRLL